MTPADRVALATLAEAHSYARWLKAGGAEPIARLRAAGMAARGARDHAPPTFRVGHTAAGTPFRIFHREAAAGTCSPRTAARRGDVAAVFYRSRRFGGGWACRIVP